MGWSLQPEYPPVPADSNEKGRLQDVEPARMQHIPRRKLRVGEESGNYFTNVMVVKLASDAVGGGGASCPPSGAGGASGAVVGAPSSTG